MSENEFQIPKIIAKHLKGELDPEQRTALEEWLNESAANRAWFNEFSAESEIESRFRQYQSADKELLWEITQRKIKGVTAQRNKKPSFNLWQRIGIAAAVAAIIVSAGIWFLKTDTAEKPKQQSVYANDILPGKQGATLTLANGKVIQLSDAKSGLIVGHEIKYDDGTALSGLQPSLPKGERSIQLTASTAKGQTYRFTLPDGTKIWLNAASTIKFPASFNGLVNRAISLSGEAYLEVAKDKSHPFIVKTDKQEVEVLGTHFNINAYKDEWGIRTTLLEGSVRVAFLSPFGRGGVAREGRILKPNQQSVLTGSNRLIINEVDAEDAVAWKNGLFVFDSETLEDVMRKISRWYDLDVIYKDQELKKSTVGGTVSRYENVSKILHLFEKAGKIQFTIEGKVIVISKK